MALLWDLNKNDTVTVQLIENNEPTFAETNPTRTVAEDAAPGTAVGAPVTATDPEGRPVRYSLSGPEAEPFTIDPRTGQIWTTAALDHESVADSMVTGSHTFTVQADVGHGAIGTVEATVTVTDVEEQPMRPEAPTATPAPGDATALDVAWTEPERQGGPAITGYEVQHRLHQDPVVWTAVSVSGAGTSTTLTGLAADTDYRVRVRALNGETPSEWSPATTGRPGGAANTAPTGFPVIGGTAMEGVTLHVDTTGITDANGLSSPGFAYQWERVRGGVAAGIAGANASSYQVVTADVGAKLRARVSFTDDGGFLQTLTSPETATVSGFAMTDCELPDLSGRNEVWRAVLTVGGGDQANGYPSGLGALSDTDFNYESERFVIWALREWHAFEEFNIVLELLARPSDTAMERLRLHVCGDALDFKDNTFFENLARTTIRWDSAGLTWFPNTRLALALSEPATNIAPVVATAIPDQAATAGTAFSYAFPADTFSDADGDALGYTAARGDGGLLPSWLTFTAATRTLSGTPLGADVGTVEVKLTAIDGNGGSVDDTFDITVSAAGGDATGKPAVTGAPQVSQRLEATIGAIDDDDGLPGSFPAGYDFQWVRVDGSSHETDIPGATSRTYDPTGADVGQTLKVKVSFSDGIGTAETLVSDTTEAVVRAPQSCAADRPSAEWCTTLTVEENRSGTGTSYGFSQGMYGTLDESSIEYDTTSREVQGLWIWDADSDADAMAIGFDDPQRVPYRSVFDFGGEEFTASASAEHSNNRYRWSLPAGMAWLDGQKVTVSTNLPPTLVSATVSVKALELAYHEDLDAGSVPAASDFEVKKTPHGGSEQTVALSGAPSIVGKTLTLTLGAPVAASDTDVKVSYAPGSDPVRDESGLAAASLSDADVSNESTNDEATGAPAITGAPQVGQTLTAGAGDMDDDDGLPETDFPTDYTFQWVRVDSSDIETDISGATSQSYDPTDSDVGQRLKVEVSFTDGVGNAETLASEPTAAVVRKQEDCAMDRPSAEWCTTLSVGKITGGIATSYGFIDGSYGALDSPTSFAHGATTYEVQGLFIWKPDSGTDEVVIDFETDRPPHGTAFDLGGETFTTNATAEHVSDNHKYTWDPPAGFAWLEDQKVTVSANLPPTLVSATVRSTALVLTYHEDLDAGSVPAATDFEVKKTPQGGAEETVTLSGTPSISGKTLTLTLASAVLPTDTDVKVSYTPGSDPVQDESGLAAASLIGEAVAIDTTNNAPTLAAAIPDQTARAGTQFSYEIPNDTFDDADGDTLTYTATQGDGTALPAWITFDATTRTLSGTPAGTDVETLTVKVTASDPGGASASDEFDIVVREALTPPPTTGTVVAADWALTPSGLSAGDRFRLIFATSGTKNAVASDINEYNTFVQNAAAGGHNAIRAYSTGFRVVGCTTEIDARDNTATTSSDTAAAVYWLGGTKVADDYEDFYDGSWDDEVNLKDESGNNRSGVSSVFTGCRSDGTLPITTVLGASRVTVGKPNGSGGPIGDVANIGGSATLPFYGLSEVFKVPAPNATGAPAITGAPQVGQTLTAGLGTIADDDGLPTTDFPTDYTFQWVRVDSSDNETDISGATSQEYQPEAADLDHRLKVEVTFTDGGGTAETLASEPTAAVVRAAQSCATDRAGAEWCTTLTVAEYTDGSDTAYGFSHGTYGALDAPVVIAYGATSHEVRGVWIWDADAGTDEVVMDFDDGRPPRGTAFDLGGQTFAADATAEHGSDDTRYVWNRPANFTWLDGQRVTVSANLPPVLVSAAVNDTALVLTYHEDMDTNSVPAATDFAVKKTPQGGTEETVALSGAPSISGKALTLTLAATVSSTDTDVKVSYMPGTSPIQDASGLAAAGLTDETVTNGTTAPDATGAPAITGAPQVGQTLTAGAGDMEDDDGLPETDFPAGYTFQWVRVDSSDIETDISGATSPTYEPEAADLDHRLKVEVTFTDGGGTAETLASEATAAVVRAEEDCASDRANAEWCTTMTAEEKDEGLTVSHGFEDGDFGTLTARDIAHGPTSYRVSDIKTIEVTTGVAADRVYIAFETGRVPHGSVFNLGGTTFAADADSEDPDADNGYFWPVPAGFAWLDGQRVTVSANLPPALVSATVDGAALVLTYHEDLDADSVPAATDFAVKKTPQGGTEETVALSGAPSIDGRTLTLTLAAAVAATDTDVKVTYTVPSSNPVQDAAGLAAPALSDEAVTNNTGATAQLEAITVVSSPKLPPVLAGGKDSYAPGETLKLEVAFSTAITVSGTPELHLALIENDDSVRQAYTASYKGFVKGSDSELRFTWTIPDDAGDDARVAIRANTSADRGFQANGATITTTGAGVVSLSHETLVLDIRIESGPPVIHSASVNGRVLSLVYSNDEDAASTPYLDGRWAPATDSLVVTVTSDPGGASETTSEVAVTTTAIVADDTVEAFLDAPVESDDEVTVAHAPMNNADTVTDQWGNAAEGFDAMEVENLTTAGSDARLASLEVDGLGLWPAFTPARTIYLIEGQHPYIQTTVKATTSDPSASVKVHWRYRGTGTDSEQAPPATVDIARTMNDVRVRVTTTTNEKKRYSIVIPHQRARGNAARVIQIDAPEDGEYEVGKSTTIGVEFDKPVHVEGTAILRVKTTHGTGRAWLIGHGNEDRTRLEFEYKVPEEADESEPLTVAENGLDANGGAIRNWGYRTEADLSHKEVTGDETIATAAVRVDAIEVPGGAGPWGPGATIEFAATFTAPVTVTGTPVLRIEADGATHDATLTDGSGTPTLVFAWTVPDTLGPDAADVTVSEGIVLDQGASIVDAAGVPAETAHPEVTFEGLITPETGPAPLTASFENPPPGHDGQGAFTVDLVFSEVPSAFRNFEIEEALRAWGGEIRKVRIVDGDKAHRRITITPHGGYPVLLGLEPTTDCAGAHAMCTPAGGRLEAPVTITVNPLPTLSVSDAATREGPDATLDFTLTLDHAASFRVNATIATQDGTANAGEDYAAPAGLAIAFTPGQTEKTVSIAVMEDELEEDDETMTLRVDASAANDVQWQGSAQGTGTIRDPAGPGSIAPLTARFENVPEEHLEGAFTVDIIFSEPPVGPKRPEVRSALRVDGGQATRVRRVGGDARHRRVTIEPSSWGDVQVTLPAMANCTAPRTLCTAAGGVHESAISTTVPGPATLSVADTRVEEAPDAVLAFVVTLGRERSRETRVDYATEDGTADAGSDYTTVSGTLTFAPGEIAKTVSVPVLDDAHDEGEETVLLELSNPNGARIERGTATGTIENTDHMPKAWLVRFAREAAETAFDAAEERLRARPGNGWSASVAGVPLGAGETDEDTRDDLDALARWLDESPLEAESRKVTGRDLLTGTRFSLNASDDGAGGSAGSVWARGMLSSFSGTEDELTLEGDISSIMLGADLAQERWAAGAMLAHSRGEGTYTEGAHGGNVESTITGLYPYGRFALNERVTLWGIAGYGAGTLGLTPEGQKTIETDIDLAMAGLGLRGTVLRAPPEGGPEITLSTDALGVRSTSDKVEGDLVATQGSTTRLRLGAQSAWHGLKLGETLITPRLELGLRHDGGDAETGFGVDVGGGLRWTGRAFNAELSARGLLSHESDGFTDRGLAASVSYDPRPGSDRGLAVTLRQSIGGPATGGVDALRGHRTIEALGAGSSEGLAQHRIELRAGYGLPAFGGGFTATPEVGLELSNGGRDYRLGWRLGYARSRTATVELNVEARRRESDGADAPEHALGLSFGAQW